MIAACLSLDTRFEKDITPVKGEILFLVRRECSDVQETVQRKSHPSQAVPLRNRGDHEVPAVREGDEATVEEPVEIRGQEEPILAVETLLVRGRPPGLDMAGDEEFRVIDSRDPTTLLQGKDALSELPLASTGLDDLILRGRPEVL